MIGVLGQPVLKIVGKLERLLLAEIGLRNVPERMKIGCAIKNFRIVENLANSVSYINKRFYYSF